MITADKEKLKKQLEATKPKTILFPPNLMKIANELKKVNKCNT